MRLAAHHVLANTAVDKARLFPCSPFLHKDEQRVEEIDGLVGLSPELLNKIQEITFLALSSGPKNPAVDALAQYLRCLRQECSDTSIDPESKITILRTAETYRLGALLYLDCRFPR